LANAGYHTVVLPNAVPLTNGMAFSIVVELTTPGFNYPIPFEFADSGYSSQATASPGQSYFSPDGSSWQDATTYISTASVCLKAFTQRMPVAVLRDTAGAIRAGSYAATTLANGGGCLRRIRPRLRMWPATRSWSSAIPTIRFGPAFRRYQPDLGRLDLRRRPH